VANEVIRARANVLAENVTKWGTGNVVVTNNDPVHFGSMAGLFDVMLVDAPCSGEGLFRKDPEAVKEWSEANVQLCSQRQQRILADAWGALKPGGVLIYSTCTYEKAENEDNLKWLLENESVENVPVPLNPGWGVEKVTAGGLDGYRFWPHRTKGEGLFMAAVRKTNGKLHQPRRSRNKTITFATRSETDMVHGWLSEDAEYNWIKHNERLLALPSGSMDALEQIAANLQIVGAGTEVAEIIRNSVNPLPGLALSVHLNRKLFPMQEVEPETALRYLRREDVLPEGLPSGWGLVSYRNLPLGWVKRINNRANNYWPKEWRLRMDLSEALRASEQEVPLIHWT
jgi:NOL1/NOP2/fmu family ribosome biogenesis protein